MHDFAKCFTLNENELNIYTYKRIIWHLKWSTQTKCFDIPETFSTPDIFFRYEFISVFSFSFVIISVFSIRSELLFLL